MEKPFVLQANQLGPPLAIRLVILTMHTLNQTDTPGDAMIWADA
jgi:hypothetical protein